MPTRIAYVDHPNISYVTVTEDLLEVVDDVETALASDRKFIVVTDADSGVQGTLKAADIEQLTAT